MPKNRRNQGNGGKKVVRPAIRRERHLSVRSELKRQPDVNKIARAVVAFAIAQAEKEATEEREARDRSLQGSDTEASDD